jgi:hypothetical protein
MRQAVSITLRDANVLWLRAQARATNGNVSEIVDRIVTEARTAGRLEPAAIRSVAGTIDLGDDEELAKADSYVRALFAESLRRPMLVRERPPKRRRRRG